MKKYWHELSDEEQIKIFKRTNYTVGEFMAEYSQPDWCGYPNALEGGLGCWGLVFGSVKGEATCKECDYYKPTEERVSGCRW